MLFWDLVVGVYDLFEKLYNGRCYDGTGARVAQEINKNDIVLECACGTGSISKPVAKKCKKILATDMSLNMLKRAKKNCKECTNIVFRKADIMSIRCKDNRFDKVFAKSGHGGLSGNPKRLMAEINNAFKGKVRKNNE